MKIVMCLLGFVVLLGCKKNGDHTPFAPLQFEISGLPDTARMEQTDTTEILFSIDFVSGFKDRVALQISNLPSTISASFSSNIDTPSYSTVLRLVSHGADTGTYNIVITAADSRQTKIDSFKLRVNPTPVNPALTLVGNYAETGPCTLAGSINNTVSIAAHTPEFNKVIFSRLWNNNPNTVLQADLDPVSQTISIPSQTVNSAVFSGTGFYSGNQIHINYTVEMGFTKDNCSVVLNKQ
ncbi:MAG TPA: hypothetical protein PL009_12630 [Flavipsychrobacter sp.]|nr:hypothetical protein [Flavipsychrobacter sp.]